MELGDKQYELNKEFGKTIIMVTHDMEHVLKYCEEVIVMKNGQIEKVCEVKEFFKDLDFLKSFNITPPAIIRTRMLLAEKGFDMSGEILTMQDLVKKIKEGVKKNG